MLRISLHASETGEKLQEWTFTEHLIIKIGRATTNDVVLSSPVVSRYHLKLSYLFGQWRIDSFGANGTYINGNAIHMAWIHADGLEVQLGHTGPLLRLWLVEAAQPLALPQQENPKPQSLPSGTHIERESTSGA